MVPMDTLFTYDIVLLPDMQQATTWRKNAARAAAGMPDGMVGGATEAARAVDGADVSAYGENAAQSVAAASFGCEVTTFGAWTADLWGLYGDGRTPVSALTRSLLFHCDDVVKAKDSALRRAVARVGRACIREASGLSSFEEAVEHESDVFAYEESEVLVAVRAYYRRLAAAKLIEPGQILALLPGVMPKKPLRVLVWGCPPLTAQQQAFFDACDWISVDVRPAPGQEGPVRAPEGVLVRYAFPSGEYAWPALLADIVREEVAALEPCAETSSPNTVTARVAVAAKDPAGLYEKVSDTLSREGITVALHARRPFIDTAFGQAFLSLACFFGYNPTLGTFEQAVKLKTPRYNRIASVEVEPWDRFSLADFMLSPFSGISNKQAYGLDAKYRGDRLVTRADVAAELRVSSRMFSLVERIFNDIGDREAAEELVSCAYAAKGVCAAWTEEQVAAAGAIRQVLEAAAALGLGREVCLQELASLAIDISRSVSPKVHDTSAPSAQYAVERIPDLLICDQLYASSLERGSCNTVVIADLTSEAYPASDKEDATRTLLDKLGIARTDSALARMRRAFFALEHLPRRQLVLQRCLNNADADPLYPSVVLEEFVDCYRADPTDLDDIDNSYSLPVAQQEGMQVRGEEVLLANHELEACATQEIAARIAYPQIGVISAEAREQVVLPRVLQGGVVETAACLSPSQIESYLECPYKWFADRRLRLEDLDAGFGPLEMGDFAHNALESFYRHFKEQTGLQKVTESSLAQAKEIMKDVLNRHEALQPHLKARENRLIATSELEVRQLQELRGKLLRYLDYEVKLLPTFHPEYLEYAVAGEGTVDYAGQKLIGTADRIDIDADGNCVIIDYKGSISSAYALSNRADGYMGKVQALIYAQVVRRTLELNPVGALYVCYGRQNFARGAYAANKLNVGDMPGISAKQSSWPEACKANSTQFSDLLDETEEAVAVALEKMLAGEIAPNPASAEACKWCSVTTCPERRC